MCGFAGVFASNGLRSDELQHQVERMVAPIHHRGPDDEGVWVHAAHGVALGFRRLAIIDLSQHGHQPMHSASGRFVITFNGEVYNYREIRQELEQLGVRGFRGHSDTEVILAAFERWGIRRAVRRFTGMFAIAVWDARERSLTLVRDRLGIKPLYVHASQSAVLFGSELKSLLTHPTFDRTLDTDALTDYFRYLYVPAPRTPFLRARKVPAGSMLTIRDPSSTLPDPEVYWSVTEAARRGASNPLLGSDAELTQELESQLGRAVGLRMRSDVPVGVLLSGGVDSSLVAALMQAATQRPIRTFCIGFDQALHDESAHAAAVAKHLGADHTAIHLTGREALENVARSTRILDEPFANPSHIPTLLVCEVARRDVTVALAGDGGDEVFAGYNRYTYGSRIISWAALAPHVLRRAAASPLRGLPARHWDRGYERLRRFLPTSLQERLVGEKISKLGSILAQDSAAAMYRSLLSACPDAESLVRGGRRLPDWVDSAFAADGPGDLLGRMQLADQAGYLADDLLAKVDRASMAVSLEVRVPMIDHNVVELSWRLPRRVKIRHGRGKWILREVLYKHVPRSIVDRPKMGFSVPLEHWLRGPLRPWAEELLHPTRLGEHGLLDEKVISHVWRAFLAGHGQHALSIWTILMFEAWREGWASSSAREPVLIH